jgi:hypothetical protein
MLTWHQRHTSTTTIKAGGCKSKKQYIAYKEFACCYSPMLDKAFDGLFIEGQTQCMTSKTSNPLKPSDHSMLYVRPKIAEYQRNEARSSSALHGLCVGRQTLDSKTTKRSYYGFHWPQGKTDANPQSLLDLQNTTPGSKWGRALVGKCAFEMEKAKSTSSGRTTTLGPTFPPSSRLPRGISSPPPSLIQTYHKNPLSRI